MTKDRWGNDPVKALEEYIAAGAAFQESQISDIEWGKRAKDFLYDAEHLRAELLRLQAERDERDATIRVLRKQRAYLIPEGRQMRQERDALLEALKDAWVQIYDEQSTQGALDVIRKAIDDVEGKDG